MKIYVVIENIDDYPECGGGKYPDAVFMNHANAERYAERKNRERLNKKYSYYVEPWETADERENQE